jgi:phage N-6-adenine-methyltransferase
MSDSDSWETPQWLFDLLDKEFNFVVDACAVEDNVKAQNGNFFQDASKEWKSQYLKIPGQCPEDSKNAVFLNPPYSNPGPFLERAWEFSKNMKVVCLVRDDPTTKWYKKILQDIHTSEPKYGMLTWYLSKFDSLHLHNITSERVHKPSSYIIRLPKRLKFERNGVPGGTYNFPCCIIVMDRR